MTTAPFDTARRIDTTPNGTRRLIETRYLWNADRTGALALDRVIATSATEAGRNTIATHTMIGAYHRVLAARGERCFDCLMGTEHDLPNGPWPRNNHDATDEDDANGDYSTAAEWDVYQHAAHTA